MTAKEISNHPENHVLASFTDRANAIAAKEALINKGLTGVELLQGEDPAHEMNTRAQWFADTDDQLRRFENKLREGYTVLSVEVEGKEGRHIVQDILSQCDAEIITHFGKWVTETKRV